MQIKNTLGIKKCKANQKQQFKYCRLWLLGACAYKFQRNNFKNLSCLLSTCAYILFIKRYLSLLHYASLSTSLWILLTGKFILLEKWWELIIRHCRTLAKCCDVVYKHVSSTMECVHFSTSSNKWWYSHCKLLSMMEWVLIARKKLVS